MVINMRINSSVCAVTGGASGLGAATVKLLYNEGAKVAIWDVNEDQGRELEKQLGSKSIFCKVDVTDEDSIKAAIQATVEKFGQINVLVNCAGIILGALTLTKQGPHSLEAFERIIKVNVSGTFNVLRLVAHQMASQPGYGPENERGVIINTASVAGYEGQRGQAAYGSSKGAIIGMTLPVARDLAFYNIRVATIAPGLFVTPMGDMVNKKATESLRQAILLKRFGEPSEFALTAKFIIENGYITGSVFRIDGGVRLPHI